jgi:hypothetical protein
MTRTWWLGGFVIGALIGGFLSSLGGIVLGVVFVLPFAAARGRAGAAISGGLVGSGLAAIAIHGVASDLQTIAAAITLAAGLLLTVMAFTRR